MTTNKENLNIEFTRGDTGHHMFTFTDKDGAPYDLTGFTIRSQARLSPDSEATIFDVTISDGQYESDFAAGIVHLVVPASSTINLPKQCVYDVQATQGSFVLTVAKGRINTLADVTR